MASNIILAWKRLGIQINNKPKTMYELTAFLCGHFHRDKDVAPGQLSQELWSVVTFDDAEAVALKRMFYAEFIDFFSDSCTIMRKKVDVKHQLPFRDSMYSYNVDEITVFQMPLGMTLFSVGIRMDVNDLNDVTAVLSSLRMLDNYKDEIHKPFIEAVLMPVKRIYDKAVNTPAETISALVENGNKLRLFQVVNEKMVDGAPDGVVYENRDLLLYQLGSLAKVTTGIDDYSPSDEYLQKVLEESRISIFRNWQALALMDTFTILSSNAPEWLVGNWTKCYFRLIYIHSLFSKCYLFRLNKQLRSVMTVHRPAFARLLAAIGSKESEIYTLIREFKKFEKLCRFHKISYNFMPLEMVGAIDRGLCISEELEQLDKVIEREKQRRDEANDKIVNTLLFVLSTLTLGSAIWDFSCLLDQMFPYADYLGSSILGYRTVALLVLLALAFVLTRLLGKDADD